MREPYHQLYVHLVWSTWDRLPSLTPDRQKAAFACIQAECKEMGVEPVALGGVEDHVHLLVRIPPTVAVSALVKQVKGVSSHLLTHAVPGTDGFRWQGGYGAFTIAKAGVPEVVEYVRSQQEHHQSGSVRGDWEPQDTVPDD
jgi:REP element-mobilizing transposase RayT